MIAGLALLALAGCAAAAQDLPPPEFTLRGEVVRVEDRDMIALRGTSGARFVTRLADIDTRMSGTL